MTEQEIKENLCCYDLRNPDNTVVYGMTKEEIKEDGYGNHAKKDCSCDNCFYGIRTLAEELLKYVELQLEAMNDALMVHAKYKQK